MLWVGRSEATVERKRVRVGCRAAAFGRSWRALVRNVWHTACTYLGSSKETQTCKDVGAPRGIVIPKGMRSSAGFKSALRRRSGRERTIAICAKYHGADWWALIWKQLRVIEEHGLALKMTKTGGLAKLERLQEVLRRMRNPSILHISCGNRRSESCRKGG